MQYELTPGFFSENRRRLSVLLKAGSVAVINSNDVLPTNADGTFKLKQNNDLYYLTGILQAETMLLLFPDHPDEHSREILLISQPDPVREKWDGKMLTREAAATLSGIGHVRYTHEAETIFHELAFRAEHIYLNAIEHPRAKVLIKTRDDRFAETCREKYRLHRYERLAPLMMKLRMSKSEAEITMMRRASAITEKGFRRLLKFIRPGVAGKQIEAEMLHEYLFNGGEQADYTPIVASGIDSCILHSVSNSKVCAAGDIVLIDAAASFKGYQSDLTRVVPVSGRFSAAQKQVYRSVLDVHNAMRGLMKPGALMKELQAACNELLIEQYVKLGLCTIQEVNRESRAYFLNRYSYHGFSHFLGLDVHDVGDFEVPLTEGVVLTNEPGIYVAEQFTGVRLENNLLITANGNEDLMASIPIEAEEIEELMNASL